MSMKRIAIVNQKGGVGKTTIAVNLSHALAKKGKKVLLIDGDGQGHSTKHLGHEAENTLYHVLVENLDPQNAIINSRKNLDIIPADRGVRAISMKIASEVGRDTLLKNAMKGIKGYDYVIIDCPPGIDALSFNLFLFADEALVPLSMDPLAAEGTAEMVGVTFKALKDRLNHDLKINGFIGVAVDKRTKRAQEVMAMLKKAFGKQVYKTSIRTNTRMRESPGSQQSIFEYDPKGNGAKDFDALAQEFLTRTQRGVPK